MATRTTLQRLRPTSSTAAAALVVEPLIEPVVEPVDEPVIQPVIQPVTASVAPVQPARCERPLQPAHVANARVLGSHGCSCTRSPRAIAHWLLSHQQPAVEPTDLALDREEAALWSNTLTGRLKIEHTAVDGTCALHLGYADGRSITIAMGELQLAAIAAA